MRHVETAAIQCYVESLESTSNENNLENLDV